jgi:hypothetical protein
MAWGKKKVAEPETHIEDTSIAVSEVMRVKSKYESDKGYYSVKLEYPGSVLDKNRIEEVELRPRSQEEFDVYEVGQRVTIGAQPWLQSPTEAAVDMRAEGVDWEIA